MIRRIDEDDFETLAKWYEDRVATMPERGFYSPTGFIVDGIAAGFLMLTNAKVALMENFVTNPQASYEDRKRALGMLSQKMDVYAQELGYKYVMGITVSDEIEKECLKYGYTSMGSMRVFAKEL